MSVLRFGCRSFSSGKSSAALTATAPSAVTSPKFELGQSRSGVQMACLDDSRPVVTVAVGVKGAGSVGERYDNAGVSHALRLACGLSTKNVSRFGMIRSIQQLGASLECTQSRDNLIYSLDILRDYVNEGVDYLVDTITSPAFKKWEVSDNIAPAMKIERQDKMNPFVRALEELFRISYRGGYGNSLYCPERNIGKISDEMLKSFHSEYFVRENIVVGTGGLEQRLANNIADMFAIENGKAFVLSPQKFVIGESRIDTLGPNAYIIIGTQGEANSGDHVKVLSDALLSVILGNEPLIKYSSGGGKLAKSLRQALGNAPFGVGSVNYRLSNSTINGVSLVSDAKSIGKGIDAVLNTLKSIKITEQELNGAKKRFTSKILYDANFPGVAVNGALKNGLADISCEVDVVHSISLADVQASAERLSKAKFSMSSVGNLDNVPYLDTLQK